MPKGKELDPFTRTRICELKLSGKSYREIQLRFPEIPLSTIKYTVLIEHRRVNNASKPRPGAPKKLDSDDISCIKEHIQRDPHVKYDDLLADVDHKVKKRSIARLLQVDKIRK